MPFQDLIDKITDEAERGQLDALAKKYPVLKNFAESGEVFEKLKPRFKALHDTYVEKPEFLLDELEAWRDWKSKAFDPERGMTREQARLTDAMAAAEARIHELQERTDTDMTPDEIKALFKEFAAAEGIVTTSAMEARFTKALSPASKEGEQDGEVYGLVKNVNNNTALRFQDVYAVLEDKAEFHRATFGEPLKRNEVFKYMQDNKVWDANLAYDQMNAKRLSEKSAADTAAQIAKAKEDGIKEGQRQAMAQSGGRAIPVDGGGSSPMGLAEARMRNRLKPKEGETFVPKLGQGIGAQYSAERREKILAGGGDQ